jgi:hypothetical protein
MGRRGQALDVGGTGRNERVGLRATLGSVGLVEAGPGCVARSEAAALAVRVKALSSIASSVLGARGTDVRKGSVRP